MKNLLLALAIFATLPAFAQPANDGPCGAVGIPVSIGSACTPTTVYTYTGATVSTGAGTATCGIVGNDIWYTFTVSAGNVTINFDTAVTSVDFVAAIYSATSCSGPFTQVACDDDGGPGLLPQFTALSLTAGTYYLRVWAYSYSINNASFKVCINREPLSVSNTGIGTVNPTATLDVNGSIKIRGGSPAAGKVLTSDASGVASWVTPAVPTPPANLIQTVNAINGVVASSLPSVANTYQFTSPTTVVTLAANQRVVMNITIALGRTTAGAGTFILDAGYQLSGATIVAASGGSYIIHRPNFTGANTTQNFFATGTFKPGAGTYTIGAVINGPTVGFFNYNDYMNCTYMIINE